MTDERKFATPATQTEATCGRGRNSLNDDLIGRKLKQVYSSMVSEPLPDRFEKLLKDLAQGRDKK